MNHATSSSRSHRRSFPNAPKLNVVTYACDGAKRSCRIRLLHTSYESRNPPIISSHNEVKVTLSRAGHWRKHTQLLLLDQGWTVGEDEHPNGFEMRKWYPSLVNNSTDLDPTGRSRREDHDIRERDPGWLVARYRRHLDCLTVLAGDDMKGKWRIQPKPREEREALWNARQAAIANQRKATISQAEDARFPNDSVDKSTGRYIKDKTLQATGPRAAASGRSLRTSSGSSASTFVKKEPRGSITSIISKDTSSTLSNDTNVTKARLHPTK